MNRLLPIRILALVSCVALRVAAAQTPTPAVSPAPAASPSPAATPTPTDEDRALEEEIRKELGETRSEPRTPVTTGPAAPGAPATSMNPDLSFVADFAVAGFSHEDPSVLQTGGHDPNQNGFTLQQLEMSVRKPVDPYFRFDANLVFSQFGVEVEEAYATTTALPWSLQARVGQFLTRFGRINATHPHSWDFVDQAFPVGRVFGGEGNRGLGAEASVLAPLPWFTELSLSATEADGESTARSFFGASDQRVLTPLDAQYTFTTKQFFEPSDTYSILWGLSYAAGPNATGHDNRSEIYGTDLYVKRRPPASTTFDVVAFQGEVFYRRRQVPNDVLSDVNAYGYVSWRFATRWATAARWEYGSPTRNLAGDITPDDLDPEWMKDRHRVSANVTFWPTEFSRMRFQAGVDDPAWMKNPNYSAMLAFEFSVGAHGAHPY